MHEITIFTALGWERRALTAALSGLEPAGPPRTWWGRLGDGALCLVVQTGMGPERAAVLGATAVSCGRCGYCLSGRFIFCKDRRGMGHGVDGAFCRYVVVRPDQLYRVPENLSLKEAAICEPLAAAVQAVTEVTRPRLGDVALVSGPGPIGLLCLKLLVADGVRTIVATTLT